MIIKFFRRIDELVTGEGTPVSLLMTIALCIGIALGVLIYLGGREL